MAKMGFQWIRTLGCIVVIACAARATVNVCDNEECRRMAMFIRGNVDTDISACQDFYQHACGNWMRRNPLPPGFARYNSLTWFGHDVKDKIYRLLQEPDKPDDSAAMRAAKLQFRICTDENQLEREGLVPILSVIQERGGWPMIIPCDRTQNQFPKSWQEVHDEYLVRTGEGALYTLQLFPNTATHRRYFALTLDQPNLFPTRPLNRTDQIRVNLYISFIADVADAYARAAGANIPRQTLMQDARDLYTFLNALEELKNQTIWRPLGPYMNVSDIQQVIYAETGYNFQLLLSLVRTVENVVGITVGDDTVVNVRNMKYLKGLANLLRVTSNRTILNYLHFHFVEKYSGLTTRQLTNMIYQVYGLIPSNRTVLCGDMPNLERAKNRMYIKRYFPASKIGPTNQLLNDLKQAIRADIAASSYLDTHTNIKALAKLNNLVEVIAYDTSYATDDALDQYYAEYNMGSSLVQNVLTYYTVEYRKKIAKLQHPINKQCMRRQATLPPTSTLAAYRINYNRLEIPAALINSPAFHEQLAPMSNYAGLGAILASLLADLFIYLGTYFNDQGDYEEWASTTVKPIFVARTQCYVNQYIDSSVKELVDANISFHMERHSHEPLFAIHHFALKTIYNAHRAAVAAGTAQSLPLSEYTLDKQFFLNYASMLCENVDPIALAREMNSSAVTTSRLIVNQALANLPEFGQTFGCELGTSMNPVRKCSWFD